MRQIAEWNCNAFCVTGHCYDKPQAQAHSTDLHRCVRVRLQLHCAEYQQAPPQHAVLPCQIMILAADGFAGRRQITSPTRIIRNWIDCADWVAATEYRLCMVRF